MDFSLAFNAGQFVCEHPLAAFLLNGCLSHEKYGWWLWNFLYDWQALAAGIIALVGAAVLAVQVRMQRGELRRQRRKEEVQARLLLPHTLADVHRYLEQMGRAWIAQNMTLRPAALTDRELSTIAATATVVDKKTFETVRQFVETLQTFESIVDDPSPLNYYDILILDIARLWVLTNSLYAYGRFRADSAPYTLPSKAELIAAIDHPLGLYKLPPGDPVLQRVESGLKFIR